MAAPVAELWQLSLADASRLLRARELRSAELTEACLARMAEVEPRLNAFITPTLELAIEAASQADAEIEAGTFRGPLHGIPIALKDLAATRGVRTTAGSQILGDWAPDYDAAIVTKLRDAGAISLGKLNMHEFAYGTTSNNAFYGPVRNPWNTDCHPGGSSGGSGAAVAAGECFAATGSDTGGSIRIPAALCNIVGLMPTYGLVSRAGCTPLAWSLDHMGPLARTVEDAALMLEAMAGYDAADPASVRAPAGWSATAGLGSGVNGVRIGVARGQVKYADPQVQSRFEEALAVLRELGAELTDVSLPMIDEGLRLSILSAEASAYHLQWLRECPERYSSETRALLNYGLHITAVDHINDLRLQRELIAEVRGVMTAVDIIAMPTVWKPTDPIASLTEAIPPVSHALATRPWNHTGQPVISVPMGFVGEDDGLPVGLSLAARPFEEALLCQVAQAYEAATRFGGRRPAL